MPSMHRIGKHATSKPIIDRVQHVIYHDTSVVRVDLRDMVTTLDSGGWRTVTTKTRMNQAASEFGLSYIVYQKDYRWYVQTKSGTVEFFDGIRINTQTGEQV